MCFNFSYWLAGMRTAPVERECYIDPPAITLLHSEIKHWIHFYYTIYSSTTPSAADCNCGEENKNGLTKESDKNSTFEEDIDESDLAIKIVSKKYQYPWQVITTQENI